MLKDEIKIIENQSILTFETNNLVLKTEVNPIELKKKILVNPG